MNITLDIMERDGMTWKPSRTVSVTCDSYEQMEQILTALGYKRLEDGKYWTGAVNGDTARIGIMATGA